MSSRAGKVQSRQTPTSAKARAQQTSALLLGDPDDSFEREAERAADAALSENASLPPWLFSRMAPRNVAQRACSCGGSGKCQKCEEEEKEKATVRRKSSSCRPRSGEAPASVQRVLDSPGRPLDAATRDFFESRFRHRFDRIRIHADGDAAASADEIDALAYTVGDHVVFGRARYAPESSEGRKLLAHELAHTVQQRATPAVARVVRRVTTPGWTGGKGLNAGENPVGNIRRIPIEGLTEGNQKDERGAAESIKGRAIILLHKNFKADKPAKVLLFFHGHNEGWRTLALGNRDKDIDQIESQIDSPANEQLIGVLPQGTRDSAFGTVPKGTKPTVCNTNPLNKAFNTDAYLNEVFTTLQGLNIWTASPTVDSVMIGGHSGGGELINQGLLGGGAGSSLPATVGTLREVALFDAVNGPCEFIALEDWLERTLQKELADLQGKSSDAERLQYLKSSMRFRSYFERSAPIGNFYSQWNIGPLPSLRQVAHRLPLADFLTDWFTKKVSGLSPAVLKAWRDNYAVVDMGTVAHDDNPVNIMTAPTPNKSTPITESASVLPQREPGADGAPAPSALSLVHQALQSSSRSLTDEERRWAHDHFHYDFAEVRVHTNGKATDSARAMEALGYTVGRHVVLDPRRYDPESAGGRRLLGHELTHVLQQGSFRPGPATALRIGTPGSALEEEADLRSEEPGAVAANSGSIPTLQRAPAEGQLAKSVCETTANPPAEQKGECNYARPENCVTYENWLATFVNLKTFAARAEPAPANVGAANTFTVLGGGPATRFPDKPDEKEMAKDKNAPPVPTTGLKKGETFIDHPTDEWVKACLPENLRATAYQLPADCADIAIILRHVWLSAHHRTQTLKVGSQEWVIGDEKGGAGRTRALRAILDIGSQTVTSMVAPYSDAQGKPLRSFVQLAPLLHPGDILVWEHHDNDLDKPRTGGHTLTITAVNRDPSGKIQSMSFLQGNEPIFGDACPQGQPCPADDKGKIIQKLGLKDTKEVRQELGEAPGRRIEVADTKTNGIPVEDADLELPPKKKGAPGEKVWRWGDKTFLLVAGPPKAANRPAMATPAKGAKPERKLTDWIKSFPGSADDAAWEAVMEAMLGEARAVVEGGGDIPKEDARHTGEAAGKKLWQFAKKPAGSLGDESHFGRIQAAHELIGKFGESHELAKSRDLSSAQDKLSIKLLQTLKWIQEGLDLGARGVTDISFGAGGKSVVKVLLTGFDPFSSSGDLSKPVKGTWNPSGAAMLALDNRSVPAKGSQGGAGVAKMQTVILPVDYDEFQAGGKGLVESIVAEKAPDLDAAITVSMGGDIAPGQPVRLERFVVGTHEVPRPDKQGVVRPSLEPIPAAGGGTAGDAIMESNAPLDQIAQATEHRSKDADKDVQKPVIGTEITLQFVDAATAKAGEPVLGTFAPPNQVLVSNASTIEQIMQSMTRQASGTDIKFHVGGKDFTAKVVSGPGGNFLSNEVSYRMLRKLQQSKPAQDPLSFHVHHEQVGPIPQDTSTPEAAQQRKDELKKAGGVLNRLIETLKRIVAATAGVILDRRKKAKP